ncbi:MAG: hypothetical protein COA57_02190 [Flavobacteriales bacterium]|nr:hypothetical protein [Bacteroidales bacterium AH-315-I05]PCJ89430.1 MAG: hypothetical protein COA57_02190 [Flavobacteriales bacterium]
MAEVIETNVAYISFIEGGIIKVDGKTDAHIELEDMDENYAVFKKLVKDKKAPFLVSFGINASITTEARENFANKQRSQIKKAEAFVVKQLHHRLIASFHINHFKPAIPTKVFNSEEEAKLWLMQFV